MNKKLLYTTGSIIIGTIIGLYITYKIECYIEENKQVFKGICLFDVDDTLTTGKENELVVKECLDAGYAVGISTANPFYTPNTIGFFRWMPKNLYKFMVDHNFDTFNNVSSFYLNGKIKSDAYNSIIPNDNKINIYGWRKGLSLISTANLYGISDTNKMILFDDNREYIKGIKAFNNGFKIICSGKDCGGNLDVSTVLNAINN